eukprot:Pgem_evm1s14777
MYVLFTVTYQFIEKESRHPVFGNEDDLKKLDVTKEEVMVSFVFSNTPSTFLFNFLICNSLILKPYLLGASGCVQKFCDIFTKIGSILKS